MARMRAQKAPKHYQESGKRTIESHKRLIQGYREEIKVLQKKKKKNTEMKKTTDSFKKELGKNAGKWMSNKIFGDVHTPSRKVLVEKREQKIKEKELELELKSISNNRIKKLTEKRNDVLNIIIPNNKNDLFNLALHIITEIKSIGWSSDSNEESEHKNNFSDTALFKLIEIKSKLSSLNSTNEVEFITKEIKQLKQKKFIQKYLLFAVFSCLFLTLFVLYQLGMLKK